MNLIEKSGQAQRNEWKTKIFESHQTINWQRKQWSRTTYLYSIISLYWYIIASGCSPHFTFAPHIHTTPKKAKKRQPICGISSYNFCIFFCIFCCCYLCYMTNCAVKVRSLFLFFFVNLITSIDIGQQCSVHMLRVCVCVFVREFAWTVLNVHKIMFTACEISCYNSKNISCH